MAAMDTAMAIRRRGRLAATIPIRLATEGIVSADHIVSIIHK